ncbi:MAG: exodeoxyribonuclease VII large subunit [Candidatus Thermofonsia bacterium]|nr:MAG: exodeoxyribonuclease VII large subunit [Candidatus Thermofonsia bacterium]
MGFLRGQPSNTSVWQVGELTSYIKELFDLDFRLKDVEVAGEISNFRQARSGHLYFTLKDQKAQLPCVMWRSAAEKLAYLPQDGDAVVAAGRVSVYEAGGAYQLYATDLKPAGRGDLALAFEQLKQRLAVQGLFDEAHKKPIPPFPQKIGIVTSADAAALRDILNVLRRRYPLVSVLIAPTLVQGNEAPPQIVRALCWLDGRHDIDTIILARGGGSMEDLWAFNDEDVARAIFEATHPVITGVGHEIDFTIADFVADLRAPTPSAAAELAVPDVAELRPLVAGLARQLTAVTQQQITDKQWQLQSLRRTLKHFGPTATLDNNRQRLDTLVAKMDQAITRHMDTYRHSLALAEARLKTVSPQATLNRGYAIVRNAAGQIIRQTNQTTPGEDLSVQLSNGRIRVTVKE